MSSIGYNFDIKYVRPILKKQGQNFKSHVSKNKSEWCLKIEKYIKNGDSTDGKE